MIQTKRNPEKIPNPKSVEFHEKPYVEEDRPTRK
jgi:hypothetical protein